MVRVVVGAVDFGGHACAGENVRVGFRVCLLTYADRRI